MAPSADGHENPLPGLESTLHVIEALDVGHHLLQGTIRLHILGERPHGVTTDDSLRDRRTVVGGRLDGEPKAPAPTERTTVASAPAMMPRREDRARRRGAAGARRYEGSSTR